MVATEKIDALLRDEGIALDWGRLPLKWNAYFRYTRGGTPMILCDWSLKNDERAYRRDVPHEIGHYFTTPPGNYVRNRSYGSFIRTRRYETKAMRWAVNFMIDGKEFLKLIKEKKTREEVADHFYVPEDMVAAKAYYIYRNGLAVSRLAEYFDDLRSLNNDVFVAVEGIHTPEHYWMPEQQFVGWDDTAILGSQQRESEVAAARWDE